MSTAAPWDDREAQHGMRRRTGWGVSLVLIGAALLADRMGWIDLAAMAPDWLKEPFEPHFWWRLWPLLLVLSGLIRMLSATRLDHVFRGLAEAAIGGWILACLAQLWGMSFANSWPLLVIGVGLRLVFGRPHPHHCRVERTSTGEAS